MTKQTLLAIFNKSCGIYDVNKMGQAPSHVTNGVRQVGVLSPYLFAVHLDDLFLELNNIKLGVILVKIH